MKKKKARCLPVSQRDLAAFLGVSATLLSMTNTGRHGARQLGAAPSKKMAALLLAHLQPQKHITHSSSLKKIQDRSADECSRLAKVLLSDTDHANAHLPILKRQLDEMVSNQQQDLHWMNTVDLLLATLPKTRESAKDRVWLENQQQLVLKRLPKNGLRAQLNLEVKIEMEIAKIRVYRDVLKKLRKKSTIFQETVNVPKIRTV